MTPPGRPHSTPGGRDEQITELSAHVTLNLLTNYFNHFVQTDLDLPAAPAL